MNAPGYLGFSLGQWLAVIAGWNRAHGGDKPAPPTDEEFDRAMMEG